MAKKELTQEEKTALYQQEMAILTEKLNKRLQKLAEKRERLTQKLTEKYGEDPEKLELEIAIMQNDNDVWIDIANAQFEDKSKTIELKYLK